MCFHWQQSIALCSSRQAIPRNSCFNLSHILRQGKRSWTFPGFLNGILAIPTPVYPRSGLGGSVHYEHAVPCSKRLNRAKHESGEWANHSTQRRMHHAEPLVGSTIAQMFQYVNIPLNGDVWSDMMRKDEKLSKYQPLSLRR